MQGWQKTDVGSKGEVANFHCITLAPVSFALLPDENGEGGAQSQIRLSTFVSKAFYDANRGNAKLAVKHRIYNVPIQIVASWTRFPDGVKSIEQKAYEYILANDSFFSDAIVVI